MARGNLNDLDAFLVVARERSFTRPRRSSAFPISLSHTIRGLETGGRSAVEGPRAFAPTAAGERCRTWARDSRRSRPSSRGLSDFRKERRLDRITAGPPVNAILGRGSPSSAEVSATQGRDLIETAWRIVAQRYTQACVSRTSRQGPERVSIGPTYALPLSAKSPNSRRDCPRRRRAGRPPCITSASTRRMYLGVEPNGAREGARGSQLTLTAYSRCSRCWRFGLAS